MDSKKRILCVDDHKDTVDMLAAMLGLDGYEVLGVHTVADGLNLASSDNFDVIMLDRILPDGSGTELCKMIRGKGVSTPVLFYSGMTRDIDREDALNAGAQGFLVKPVSLDELRHSLQTLLGTDGRGSD